MSASPAMYLGKVIDKKNFRAFIYGANGERRLVNSWQEFEANMQSGVWFATIEDAVSSKEVAKEEPKKKQPKRKIKSLSSFKPVLVEEPEDADDVLPDDNSVFEITDDFLRNEGN
jgi:hypothetical protein